MTTVNEIVDKLNRFAPQELAEDWDPVGLSFGSYDQQVKKIFVTLDLDPFTLKEAIEEKADLVVTHHPLIFKPIDTLNAEDSKRRLFIDIIKQDLAVFSMHTNIDQLNGGLNDWLAEKIGFENTEVLATSLEDEQIGYGRIGHFASPLKIDEIIDKVKKAYDVDYVRYNEFSPNKSYKRIGIVGGSGADFASEAIKNNVELLITGDISYHEAQDMLRNGLSFIDAGHYIEKIFVEEMTQIISHWAEDKNWSVEVVASTKQEDVFKHK